MQIACKAVWATLLQTLLNGDSQSLTQLSLQIPSWTQKGQQLQTFNQIPQEMSSNCTGAGMKSTSKIKYFLPGPGEWVIAKYFQSFTFKYQKDFVANVPKMTEILLFSVCWPRQVQSTGSCSLWTMCQITFLYRASIFSAPNRKYN